MNGLSSGCQRHCRCSCRHHAPSIPWQHAPAVAKLRLLATRAARSTQNDTTTTQLQSRVQSGRLVTSAAATGVPGAEAEPPASTAAEAEVQQTVAEAAAPDGPTAAAAAHPVQQQASAVAQQATGRWQLQQLQGLLSGPCLIAAGALACSFISLQVG